MLFRLFTIVVIFLSLTACGENSTSAASRLADVGEQKFHAIIDRIEGLYGPIATRHGAKLEVNRRWISDEVNANTMQWTPEVWELNIFGGLARDERFSDDSFTLIVCHEVGHHFGGFPFRSDWGASEGQADYFSTQSCAREVWRDDKAANAIARESVDPHAKNLCDQTWTQEDEQNLCYRSMTASLEVARFLSHPNDVRFDTPSRDKAGKKSKKYYPTPQCRLDTMVAGALCTKSFNTLTIPRTEEEAAENSCLGEGGDAVGQRPECWFVETI